MRLIYATQEGIPADLFVLTIHSAVSEHESSQKERIDTHYKQIEYNQKGLGEDIRTHPSQSVQDEKRWKTSL